MSNQFQVPNNGYQQPQQGGYDLSTDFNAPEGGSGKERRNDIQLIEQGFHPAIIWALVGIGTQDTGFGTKKNKIYIGFEFAHKKQLFYLDDTEPRSTILSKEPTFMLNDKSFLKKLYDSVYRRTMTVNEVKSLRLFDLLGQVVGVNVSHKTNKKTGKLYETIESVSTFNYPIPDNFIPELEKHFFYITPDLRSFGSSNYANLPSFIKNKILKSDEAIDAKNKGVYFAEPPKKEEPDNQQQPQQFQQQAQPQHQPQQQPQYQQQAQQPQNVAGQQTQPQHQQQAQQQAQHQPQHQQQAHQPPQMNPWGENVEKGDIPF